MLYYDQDDFSYYLQFEKSRGGKWECATYHCKSEEGTHWIELMMIDLTYFSEYTDTVTVRYFYKNANKGYRIQSGRKIFLRVYRSSKGPYVKHNKKRYYLKRV